MGGREEHREVAWRREDATNTNGSYDMILLDSSLKIRTYTTFLSGEIYHFTNPISCFCRLRLPGKRFDSFLHCYPEIAECGSMVTTNVPKFNIAYKMRITLRSSCVEGIRKQNMGLYVIHAINQIIYIGAEFFDLFDRQAEIPLLFPCFRMPSPAFLYFARDELRLAFNLTSGQGHRFLQRFDGNPGGPRLLR